MDEIQVPLRHKGAWVLSHFSRVRLFATLWSVAHQAPLSMGFSRQEYWMSCHALLQGVFLTQGSNLYHASPTLAGRFFNCITWEAPLWLRTFLKLGLSDNFL